MRHPWMFLAVMLLYAGTVGTPVVWAQSADTGILGTVADASGAVIPGRPLPSPIRQPASCSPS